MFSQSYYLLYSYIVFLIIQILIRIALLAKEWKYLGYPALKSLSIFSVGFLSDQTTWGYILPLLALFLCFVYRWRHKKINHWITLVLLYAVTLFLTFVSLAEWFFWNEFSSRFNFIAIDYLVYTKEVMDNIQESYPMRLIFLSVFIIGSLIFFGARWIVRRFSPIERFSLKTLGISLLIFPLFSYFVLENMGTKVDSLFNDRIAKELAHNGIHDIFSAFRKNEIDYDTFYSTLSLKDIQEIITQDLSFRNNNNKRDFTKPTSKPNIILILVESLGAHFLEHFGSKENITPYLDKLIEHSLFFNNIYATGTRTVRGLEAITLSLPPTPGQSLVKRPNNENLFSLGHIFQSQNYETKFIYGGYGYFDNMNYFFSHNGFTPIDRSSFSKDEIHFSNAWGVCDGDLFDKALKEADNSYKNDSSFFHFILTTSNHRPFTYPDGLIDIPSGYGREGAVKYTDYAIGTFLQKAQKKAWFNNTIFVIVADHSDTGRGRIDIPISTYRIPLVIYAPQLIKSQKIELIGSQIDIGPTLAAMAGVSYDQSKSTFLGKNLLQMTPQEQRAIMATYQTLGYYQDHHLVALSPNKKVDFFYYDPSTEKIEKEAGPGVGTESIIFKKAVTYYQYASYLWKNKLLKISPAQTR